MYVLAQYKWCIQKEHLAFILRLLAIVFLYCGFSTVVACQPRVYAPRRSEHSFSFIHHFASLSAQPHGNLYGLISSYIMRIDLYQSS